jgi:predicted nucleic acid-binding Zn ribbon protein
MESMRDLLRSNMAGSLKSLEPEARFAAAWPVACGQKMAEHARVAGFSEGVLSIEVDGAAWLKEMRSNSARLKAELGRIAGIPLTDILFTAHSSNAPEQKNEFKRK